MVQGGEENIPATKNRSKGTIIQFVAQFYLFKNLFQLASLLLKQKHPGRALEIIDELLKELRKLDDKQMLTETHLTEARIYHSLQNIPKC